MSDTADDKYNLDTAEAVAHMRELREEFEEAVESHKTLAGEAAGEFKEAFFTAGAQLELFKEGLKEVVEFLKSGIEETLATQQAMSRMNAALNTVGESSLSLRNELKEQAEAIEALTGKNHTQTESMQAMLVQMGVAPEQLQRVTEAAYKVAGALGIDATNAAKTLARASAEGKEEIKRWALAADDSVSSGNALTDTLDAIDKKFVDLKTTIPQQTQDLNAAAKGWAEFKEKAGDFALSTFAWANKPNFLTDNPLLRVLGLTLEQQTAAKALAAKDVKEILEILDEAASKNKPKAEDPGMVFDADEEAAYEKRADEKDKKAAARRQKEYEEEVKEDKAHAKARLDSYAEALKVQDAQELENYKAMHSAANLEEADKTKDIKDAAIAREHALLNEFEQDKAMYDSELANRKQISDDEVALAESTAKQLISIATDEAKQLILSNDTYTRNVQAQTELQIRVGKSKTDADAAVAAFEAKSANEAKAALAQKTATVLADVATQAGIKALFYGAEGIGFLVDYQYQQAGQSFEAAAAFGVAALAAGGTAYAISSTRGLTASEDSQLQSNADSFQAQQDQNSRAASQAAQRGSTVDGTTQVNVYHLGITGMTDAAQGAELQRIQNAYNKTKTGSGASPSGL